MTLPTATPNRQTRRRFLYTAASAALVPGARARCISSPEGCAAPSNPLLGKPFPMKGGRDIDPPAPVAERPIWSEMGPSDRKHYLKLLNKAYLGYLNRTTASGCISQMQVHHLFCGGTGTQLAMDTATDVSGSDIHENYFFLPWHRAFLYFHERVLQTFVPEHPGFRLAVYDWENVKGQDLPAFYRALPRPCLQCSEAKSKPAFSRCYMQGWLVSDNVPAFVGSCTAAQVGSAGGPHSTVHSQLQGLLADMATSAADPVFWAHHANIDRYWDYWVRQYADQQWFKAQYKWPKGHFYFYDRDDSLVRISIAQMLAPEQLGYCYKPPDIPIKPLVPTSVSLTEIRMNELAALLLSALFSVLLTATNLMRSAFSTLLNSLDPATQGDVRYYAHQTERISEQTLDIMIQVFLAVYRLEPKADLSLPTVIKSSPSLQLNPGYYIVDITDGNKNFGRVGGFSVLAMQPAPYVAIDCMSADALKLIVENYQTPNRLSLVCGPADSTGEGIRGTPIPFPAMQSQVNLPPLPA